MTDEVDDTLLPKALVKISSKPIQMDDGVVYTSQFFPPDYHKVLFERLITELKWERRPDAPRWEYWTNDFGRPYTYGKGRGERTYQAHPTNYYIELVRNMLHAREGCRFEGCFLNRYDDGSDALGWHSDDDPGIDHTRPIAVVSLGQERVIQFKRIGAKGLEAISGVRLKSGSLLTMPAGFQQTHVHRIPKASETLVEPRISMTFRALLPVKLNEMDINTKPDGFWGTTP